MRTERFFKLTPSLLLAVFALCSFATHAGTISVAPTTADGGTAGINAVSDTPLYYVVTNTGTTDLRIISVVPTSEFSISQPSGAVLPLTILPLASYTVVANFRPTAAGPRSGSITIQSDDPAKPFTTVTATGYGGIEKSIRLTPLTPFEIELGQGVNLRANVTFDNNAVGVAVLNWTSSNTTVATAAAGVVDINLGASVPTGSVVSKALGTTTITVSGIQAPAVKASVAVTVVGATPHEFMGTALSDRIVRVKNGIWSPCFQFPERDPFDNRPVYDVSQIGVATPTFNTIGNLYVTAENSLSIDISEEVFHVQGCNLRTTIFSSPTLAASFRDLVVDSVGNGVASNTTGGDLWQLTPTSSTPISRSGLPPDDVGALAIDSFDNVYMSNLIKTSAMQTAGVYVRPVPTLFTCPNSTTWCPIAAVFNTIYPNSNGIPGMAAIFEGNKGYAMKIVDFDRTIVERYVDNNQNGVYFSIQGTTIVADAGEIVEVAAIDAGVDINVDANRNLIVSVVDPNGRSIVKMVDKNGDLDFLDTNEYRVIYQSTLFTQLKDIAFAAPCRDRPPTAVISTIPANGVVDLNTPLLFLGSASSDPCQDPLTYSWTNEDLTTPPVVCTTVGCQMTYTGLPALHKMGLTVRDPVGNTNKIIKTVKAGPPSVTGFWPSRGVTGTPVYLFGKNFVMAPGTVPASPTVKFNNGTLLSTVTQVLAADLLFTLQPVGTTVGKITFDTAIGSAITASNYNAPKPAGVVITGLWPSEAKAGSIVFVFGENFSGVQGANKVTINGVSTSIVQPLDTTLLLFLVPPTATTGPVCVTVTVPPPGFPPACSAVPLVILP